MADIPSSEGFIEFRVGDESFKTWYEIRGDISSKNRKHRPLIGVHGGPGASHHYINPILDLATSHNIPVILYDQIGIGNSTHLPDKPKEFWKPELFIDELENLINHFGIQDDFDLYGHSWGAMMSSQFVSTRQPKGLKRLVLSNPIAAMDLWEEATTKLLSELPQDVQDTIKRHEQAGTTDSKEYQDAVQVFNGRHSCRVDPIPDGVRKTGGDIFRDRTVWNAMNGPAEFEILGSIKHWSIIDQLHKIEVPTLLLNGHFDQAQDICVMPFFQKLRKVKWVHFALSSHMPQWEERDKYLQAIGEFLTVPEL
ncbi:proline-specific peptidase [Sistotremastrum niveocremeum HHB9708]|uniref:Proline-specific peptidase n=1 Tax=Sistotremastrum niveocremeum HHB9708 TaxID=1314777 RepID=A0A164X083_9AGAM|nr:proline-specific peptidase [Sistotremastrum niveocremeum HHB9708]